MRKNVNNDVSMTPPIKEPAVDPDCATQIYILILSTLHPGLLKYSLRPRQTRHY